MEIFHNDITIFSQFLPYDRKYVNNNVAIIVWCKYIKIKYFSATVFLFAPALLCFAKAMRQRRREQKNRKRLNTCTNNFWFPLVMAKRKLFLLKAGTADKNKKAKGILRLTSI